MPEWCLLKGGVSLATPVVVQCHCGTSLAFQAKRATGMRLSQTIRHKSSFKKQSIAFSQVNKQSVAFSQVQPCNCHFAHGCSKWPPTLWKLSCHCKDQKKKKKSKTEKEKLNATHKKCNTLLTLLWWVLLAGSQSRCWGAGRHRGYLTTVGQKKALHWKITPDDWPLQQCQALQ